MTQTLDTFYVANSQPFAAALTAFALAQLSSELLYQQVGEDHGVTIIHQQNQYLIQLNPALERTFDFRFPSLWFKLIETEKNRAILPASDDRWNYQSAKERIGEYFALRRSMSAAELRSTAAHEENPKKARLDMLQPNGTWYGMAMINQMQALTAYNEVVATWLSCAPHWSDLLNLIIQLWGDPRNDTAQAIKTWQQLAKTHQLGGKESVTASQTVNPQQGKGANRSKADALTVGNQSSFWLEEVMKFAGMFVAGIPRTISGSKDRKTYVVLPRELDFNLHQQLYQRFQQQLWPATAVKLDVLAVLGYCELFVRQFTEAQGETLGQPYRPEQYIQGFATAFYKDLGSAVATLNLATLNLPDWAGALDDVGSPQPLLDLFSDQIKLVRTLDESRSEEFELLRHYRDFLSSRDPQLGAFFAFTTAYASHVMHKMARRQPVVRLNLRSLEIIIMSNDKRRHKPLRPILESPGFQNIATAIRLSTVVPQYLRNKGTSIHEVRYGLGDKLKRKANYPLQFIQELSDFMHLYNQENARVALRYGRQYRDSITRDDIDQVAALLDEYGEDAPAVAYLLIAYGYARDPRDRADTSEPANEATPEQLGEEETADIADGEDA